MIDPLMCFFGLFISGITWTGDNISESEICNDHCLWGTYFNKASIWQAKGRKVILKPLFLSLSNVN